MADNDEIEAYIRNARPFAQPILRYLRAIVHRACPEVQEEMKWKFPHFSYKGVLCSMAAFKEHCAFGFWKGSLMSDPHHVLDKERTEGMGHLGRLKSLNDLPEEIILMEYIDQAIKLNEAGVKTPKKNPSQDKPLSVPDDFLAALKKNKKALETFEGFSYSKKKEYVEWIEGAKQQATRERRLESAIQLLSEGKSKNWKYKAC